MERDAEKARRGIRAELDGDKAFSDLASGRPGVGTPRMTSCEEEQTWGRFSFGRESRMGGCRDRRFPLGRHRAGARARRGTRVPSELFGCASSSPSLHTSLSLAHLRLLATYSIASIPSAHTMLSRAVFRSSRAVSSRLSAQVASPSIRAQSPLLRASVAPAAAISPLRAASRWYSESAEANKDEKKQEETKDEKKEGEQAKEPSEVDKLREQVEAKNKEVLELKVSCLTSKPAFDGIQLGGGSGVDGKKGSLT